MKKLFWTRKQFIKELAKEVATLQMKADKWFYVLNNQEHSSWLLDQVTPIKTLSTRLNICNEVYQEAYKIYDFRNSGKKDYVPDLKLLRSI